MLPRESSLIKSELETSLPIINCKFTPACATPEDWIKNHAEPLLIRYKVDLLFESKEYLASVDNATLKKLLVLHLCLARHQFSVRERETIGAFLNHLGEGSFLEGLDSITTKDLVGAIGHEIMNGGYLTQLEDVYYSRARMLYYAF